MKPFCSSLVLFAACSAACGDSGPVSDDVKGGSSGHQAGSGERYGCIETRSQLPSVAASGLEEVEVQAILDTFHAPRSAELVWLDGSRTQVTGTFDDLQAFKVESRDDPDVGGESARASCVDRVSLTMNVGLTTMDGRLSESFQGVAFDRDDTSGAWTAFPHKQTSDLMGMYERQSKEEGTLTAVYFGLSLSAEAFAGTVSEETQQGDGMSLSASLARWPSDEL